MVAKPLLLHPAEIFVLKITAVAVVLDAGLILLRRTPFDLPAYAMIAGLAGALILLGFTYRRTDRSERIGAVTVCAGLFILFTAALALFNYCLVPNPNATIDGWLIAIDAALGFHWPDAIEWASRHPAFNEFMRLAYLSTLPQIVMLVVVLGFTDRLDDLHALMVTITLAGCIAIMFWAIFPTTGPSAFYTVSDELQKTVRPLLGTEYGAYMVSLLRNGAALLSPNDLRGLIAFPSFHTVLACAATYYARKVWWLLPPLAIVNIAVLPAVLVHGAHHLVDIPAGMAVFVACACASRKMLANPGREPVSRNVSQTI